MTVGKKARGIWPPRCEFGDCPHESTRVTLNGRRCAYHLEKDQERFRKEARPQP